MGVNTIVTKIENFEEINENYKNLSISLQHSKDRFKNITETLEQLEQELSIKEGLLNNNSKSYSKIGKQLMELGTGQGGNIKDEFEKIKLKKENLKNIKDQLEEEINILKEKIEITKKNKDLFKDDLENCKKSFKEAEKKYNQVILSNKKTVVEKALISTKDKSVEIVESIGNKENNNENLLDEYFFNFYKNLKDITKDIAADKQKNIAYNAIENIIYFLYEIIPLLDGKKIEEIEEIKIKDLIYIGLLDIEISTTENFDNTQSFNLHDLEFKIKEGRGREGLNYINELKGILEELIKVFPDLYDEIITTKLNGENGVNEDSTYDGIIKLIENADIGELTEEKENKNNKLIKYLEEKERNIPKEKEKQKAKKKIDEKEIENITNEEIDGDKYDF